MKTLEQLKKEKLTIQNKLERNEQAIHNYNDKEIKWEMIEENIRGDESFKEYSINDEFNELSSLENTRDKLLIELAEIEKEILKHSK